MFRLNSLNVIAAITGNYMVYAKSELNDKFIETNLDFNMQ